MATDHDIQVISLSDDSGVCVRLSGCFDPSTVHDLRVELARPRVYDASRVRIDLTGVRFFDSSTLHELVDACTAIRTNGGACSTWCRDDFQKIVLEVLGLGSDLEVEARTSTGSCGIEQGGEPVSGPSAVDPEGVLILDRSNAPCWHIIGRDRGHTWCGVFPSQALDRGLWSTTSDRPRCETCVARFRASCSVLGDAP